MVQPNCRFFNGYKPCPRNKECSLNCPERDEVQNSILIVHLEALGAVVRSTSLLLAIHRKYPKSMITWLTQAPADELLQNHPLLDRVLTNSLEDQLTLKALRFDFCFVIDKSSKAAGLAHSVQTKKYFGFTTHSKTGAIIPATPAAEELWSLGLSNQKKFFENTKPETQLLIEALDLGPFKRDPYYLPLTSGEKNLATARSQLWRKQKDRIIIGLNTGCSATIPHKKLTIDYHQQLIKLLLKNGYHNLVLLGGKEDKERNQSIGLDLPVFQSPTDRGLRDGLISVAACDYVLTGDSLGMHLAISQEKFVIAWFGPTCSQEIDLYDRGIKLQSSASCAPCWKRSCQNTVMCYDQLDLNLWLQALRSPYNRVNCDKNDVVQPG